MNELLFDRLMAYGESDFYPFHMPGHKRNPEFYPAIQAGLCDITEITGFDDLHHPNTLFADLQKKTASLFGAEESYLQVNGSSGALLAALSTVLSPKDSVLVAANCHKAVWHAIALSGARPVVLLPEISENTGLVGSLSPEIVRKAIEDEKQKGFRIGAICLTSPTYEGVLSDIESICDIAHKNQIPVVVDESHGAHLPFHPFFPKSAVKNGADLVIQSLHKTLPSFTQTAVLHVQGNQVDRDLLRHFLQVYQSSSPSYLLSGSMDYCMQFLEERGREQFDRYVRRLKALREALADVGFGILLDETEDAFFAYDIGKLVFSFLNEGIRADVVSERLRERYHLEMEMASPTHFIAMTSVADTEEGFHRLLEACREMKKQEFPRLQRPHSIAFAAAFSHDCALTPGEAIRRNKKTIPLKDSEGLICGSYIGVYPPGIPVLLPGDRIRKEQIEYLQEELLQEVEVHGILDSGEPKLAVII